MASAQSGLLSNSDVEWVHSLFRELREAAGSLMLHSYRGNCFISVADIETTAQITTEHRFYTIIHTVKAE